MEQVVALLAADLADEVAQGRVRGLGERLEADRVGGVVEVAARDGRGPVAARVVEQPGVEVALDRPVVGDRVGVAAVVGAGPRAAGRAPGRARARPARASSSRRPPRGSARCPSTRSPRSRARARRRPSTAAAGRARSGWPGRDRRERTSSRAGLARGRALRLRVRLGLPRQLARAAASLSRITYPPGFLNERSSGGWSRSGSSRTAMSSRRTTHSRTLSCRRPYSSRA